VLAGDHIIGKTTSAAFGYRVGRPVAIALVSSQAIADGAEARVDVGGEQTGCRMSLTPLFDPAGGRMRPGKG
jgi:glycine cleavage system aminomethyltransferase T